jgi:hypothetical protein
MGVLETVFGIIRGGGLVSELDGDDYDPKRFAVNGFVLLVLGSGAFGFALGLSEGLRAAWQIAVKAPASITLVYLVALPGFIVTFRAMGGRASADRFSLLVFSGHLAAALVMAVCAPLVLLESLVGGTGNVLATVSVALAGVLGAVVLSVALWRGVATERVRAVAALSVGLAFVVAAAVFAVRFFAPFDGASPFFSDGVGRLVLLFGGGV